jgi:hypothetical protein
VNLVISIGSMHRIWLCFQWRGRTFCIGRYGDLCEWGCEHMEQRFITGPPWPISWALLIPHPPSISNG